ncbi:hypothetical protein DesLBE_4829 [Desulfitobacterium sp. LBE]|uniref:Uncharacterized protein n=3 Tax=root TaxID=1 RepID=A0A098B4G7_DESHA|nr:MULTISPECIES: hypothetical protein [Desulfitobacterium]KTE90158.1 hypothetical protein AT727_09530 [Desulfitobacterium hafniense]TWH60395.1 hypothetical protein DesLBE_4829 [Desulfitobacterium sp. LBE]CDX02751.1 Hypothetical protein DPCES_2864 [Desulfitobacterium hafniense]
MLLMKKLIVVFLSVILCTMAPFTSYAAGNNAHTPQASLYIRSTSAIVQAQGNGKLYLENILGATRIVDQLGVKTIEVQTLRNGYWQSIHTIAKDDYLYNTGTYAYACYYNGTPGTQYRSYVEFYVANAGGEETKIVTSQPVTAN